MMATETQQAKYRILPPDSTVIDPEVFVAFTVDGEEIEEYRTLRTQLSLRWFTDHKSLIFTSTRDNHGTSHVVANLAILFSQLGNRTLLIDANMRQPAQHVLFRLNRENGLSDLLNKGVTLEGYSHQISGFDNLTVVTAGSVVPNPLELLTQPTFWQEIEQQYDVILVDTPPALDYTDAQLVAAQVGGGVVIARNNQTGIHDLKKLETMLTVARAETVGVILKEF